VTAVLFMDSEEEPAAPNLYLVSVESVLNNVELENTKATIKNNM